MIRKRVSFIAIVILIVLGACTPMEDEPAKIPNEPEMELPENEIESPETDSENTKQTYSGILEEVKSAIETDVDLKLPEELKVDDGYLTAITTSNQTKYEVNFYVTNVPIPVNDPSLHDAHPYMIVNGTKFDSADAAKVKINYQPVIEGAEKFDLGHGITGYGDAGAGSVFLTWHEGRWSFSMRNLNSEIEKEKMIAMAKKIVEKLENQMLPAPQEIGAGMFDLASNGAAANSLMWQEKDVVYEIYTVDPLLLVDTVTEYMKK